MTEKTFRVVYASKLVKGPQSGGRSGKVRGASSSKVFHLERV